MTQKTTTAQPSSSEELWATYDGLAKREKQERAVWLRLNAEHLAACEAAAEVFHLASQAWDAYQSVYQNRSELYAEYESAVEAERSCRHEGSTPTG